MFEATKVSLREWNKQHEGRVKLQHAYVMVAGVLLVAAGLLTLLNPTLGDYVLRASVVLFGLFLVNAVAWALLDSFVLQRLRMIRVSRKR